MATTLELGPVSRIEGHLDLEVSLGTVGGAQKVVAAKSAGVMFRGFEKMLVGRSSYDGIQYTQRICGVCPISHAMAATLALEAAMAVQPNNSGRITRNLVLGANYLQSHILHFYHLAALDYIDTTGLLDIAPWAPHYSSPDLIQGAAAADLVGHYLTALAMRRKAHQMGAIFGGKMPHCASFRPGGCTSQVTAQMITDFGALLTELRGFITSTYLPDAQSLVSLFPNYSKIGRGCGNLLAYGVFDLNADGSQKLFRRGTYADGRFGSFDQQAIAEYVGYSHYAAGNGGVNPSAGDTTLQLDKPNAYSWVKAPRLMPKVFEVGPLARMYVNGDYRRGISVMDRIMARALETKKVADAMVGWLGQLTALLKSGSIPKSYSLTPKPANKSAVGLTEAARGALGHWLQTDGAGNIKRYQVVTPTAWNASPKDDFGACGAIEQALVGTPVLDAANPIELLRVVHSFDPCLACAVHTVRCD